MAATRPGKSDFSEIRARAESIGAGISLTLAVSAAGWCYAIATWHEPHRRLIASLFGLAAVAALACVLLPRERLVTTRWREPFLLGLALLNVGVAAAAVAADGGVASPLRLLFFMPLVFAALAYPFGSVVAVGVIDYLAYLGVGLVSERPAPAEFVFVAFCLATTATLCVWHAREQERRRSALERVTRADPLTGCLNRRGFEERLEGELSRASRAGVPLGLVMLDLEGFTAVNEERGERAGDELLGWALDVVEHVVRPMDTVGRVGSDEFAVVLPGAGPQDSAAVARRLEEALAARAPASFGVASFPADGVEREELQHAAEVRLHSGERERALLERDLAVKELSWATTLARAVDERMTLQYEHSWKVAQYAVGIAERMGWPERDVELLRMAGILHDVGKVAIPDHILRKREPLTEDEWAAIRTNPVLGSEMVSRIPGLERIVPWVRHSHERVDGSGYPDGLRGTNIPLASRILHVADAFDAITSGRPYRPALGIDDALGELRRNIGTQFDAQCVALLEEHLEFSETS